MADLKTTLAGPTSKNPVTINNSGPTSSAAGNAKPEVAGVGATVLKLLFEEQIMLEADRLRNPFYYPEGSDYLAEYICNHELAEHLELIKESKEACTIPVIVSIDCYTGLEWIDFAKQIEGAGADVLEISILALQSDIQCKYGSLEQCYIDISGHIKKMARIPVIMKLGSNSTNPVALIDQLYANGVAAVVLFNRFYQPGIGAEKVEYISGDIFNNASDLSATLRWVGISSSLVTKIDYTASGGTHEPDAIVKATLAGTFAIEVCSAIHQNTSLFIEEMNRSLGVRMERKGFKHISQLKGKLNAKDVEGTSMFKRTQFLKYFPEKQR